jgi:hypothetical protein
MKDFFIASIILGVGLFIILFKDTFILWFNSWFEFDDDEGIE